MRGLVLYKREISGTIRYAIEITKRATGDWFIAKYILEHGKAVTNVTRLRRMEDFEQWNVCKNRREFFEMLENDIK